MTTNEAIPLVFDHRQSWAARQQLGLMPRFGIGLPQHSVPHGQRAKRMTAKKWLAFEPTPEFVAAADWFTTCAPAPVSKPRIRSSNANQYRLITAQSGLPNVETLLHFSQKFVPARRGLRLKRRELGKPCS